MRIWIICGNIFQQSSFSVASSHILLQYWKQYQTSSFYIKTKKIIILWEVNARKVRSTFREKHYLFAYLLEGMRRLFILTLSRHAFAYSHFSRQILQFTLLWQKISTWYRRRWVFPPKTVAYEFIEIHLFLVFFYKRLIFQIYYTCSKFYGTSSM